MEPVAKARWVKQQAGEVGFDLVGITSPAPVNNAAYYREWLARGYGGGMAYLGRHVSVRANPAELVPDTRSIICVALNYARSDAHRPQPSAAESPREPGGLIAQYARGYDYHVVMHRMLAELAERLKRQFGPDTGTRSFVDTGPVLERELAARAGLGWIGRNTCLLNAQRGSYLFLGELFTSLALPCDEPVQAACAQCRRCIDACPTGALLEQGGLDARRCIAYLTIEQRGEIPAELQDKMGMRILGCDACQQVCPYNARARETRHADLQSDRVGSHVSLLQLLALRSSAYRRLTAASATRRVRRAMWRRNAVVALGNHLAAMPKWGVDEERAWRRLVALQEDADAGVARTARVAVRDCGGTAQGPETS